MSSPTIGDGIKIPDSRTVKPWTEKSASPVSSTAGAFPQKAAFAGGENIPSLGKLPGKLPGNLPSNLPLSNLSLQEPLFEKLVENAGENSVRELLRQTAVALGFPVDTLSVTFLAFARFFSLPISQALMGALRREALASSKTSSPESAKEKAALEAKALGVAAAFDKGVTLSPEALERYARFLGSPAPAGDGQEGGTMAGGGGNGSPPDREELPDEQELWAIAEKEAKEDNLLDFLNILPGKNGQYWTVFPFKIKVKGIELRVIIRLLNREPSSFGEKEHLIVDIAGSKKQYRCFLEKIAGKFRADIRVYPECHPRVLKCLLKEAERFLGEAASLTGNFPGFEEILVRNGDGVPSWVEDLCAQPLLSINKEV